MDNNLTIYYQNCRGIRTKLQALFLNVLSSSYDIIILTETWLIPDVDSGEFIDARYVVYRCDRDRNLTKKRDGGGVLIAVLREHQSCLIDCHSRQQAGFTTCAEHIVVGIPHKNINSKMNVVSAVYMPPCASSDEYISHLDALQEFLNEPHFEGVFIVGDYNLPDISGRRRPNSSYWYDLHWKFIYLFTATPTYVNP